MFLLLLFFIQIAIIFALPTKQLKYSLVIDKPFHPFNFETVLFSQQNSTIFINADEQSSDVDWFMADLDRNLGVFYQSSDLMLNVSPKDGLLSLATKQEELTKREDVDEQEQEQGQEQETILNNARVSSAVFSVKHGLLYHDGLNEFSLCCTDIQKQTYSIHLSSKLHQCQNKLNGVRLRVLNQLGIHSQDFEASEFVYQTGQRLFI